MTAFTVKWTYSINDIQRERLIETDSVNVAYDSRTPDGKAIDDLGIKLGVYAVPPGGIVVLGNPHSGADSMALCFGTVYVTNRDGKTVAKYTLNQDVEEALNINARLGNPNSMPASDEDAALTHSKAA